MWGKCQHPNSSYAGRLFVWTERLLIWPEGLYQGTTLAKRSRAVSVAHQSRALAPAYPAPLGNVGLGTAALARHSLRKQECAGAEAQVYFLCYGTAEADALIQTQTHLYQ